MGSMKRKNMRRSLNDTAGTNTPPTYLPVALGEPSSESEPLTRRSVNITTDDDDTNDNSSNGTLSQPTTALNLAKAICGAGSFALPHVFLQQGVLGGTLALTLCAWLASYTCQSLAKSQWLAKRTASQSKAIVSYVSLAEEALGPKAGMIVFILTLSASLGVCSTYLVFIGETMESLSCDASSRNIIRQLLPDVHASTWEVTSTLLLWPLSLLRSYEIFAFTSAFGVLAVVGGILVTLASGIFNDPGGGIATALWAVADMPMWPQSFASALGKSFGTIAYLFCINFLMFPILNSMAKPQEEYGGALNIAVAGVWIVNVIFAILCLGFYGDETEDLVLANLKNGPYLSSLKLLLCVDLLFTFPIVFSGGRHILEHAFLVRSSNGETALLAPTRVALVSVALAICLALAQVGGFGAVANLVGGVAQGVLAFVMPPAIALSLARRHDLPDTHENALQIAILVFGLIVVFSVAYCTIF